MKQEGKDFLLPTIYPPKTNQQKELAMLNKIIYMIMMAQKS